MARGVNPGNVGRAILATSSKTQPPQSNPSTHQVTSTSFDSDGRCGENYSRTSPNKHSTMRISFARPGRAKIDCLGLPAGVVESCKSDVLTSRFHGSKRYRQGASYCVPRQGSLAVLVCGKRASVACSASPGRFRR